MEPNEFIRETLNEITPAILKGRTLLTEDDVTRINLSLKICACIKFSQGCLSEAKELNAFIESKPKYRIWPKNVVLYMMKNFNNPAGENVIIFPTDDFNGMAELESAVEKIKNRAVVN